MRNLCSIELKDCSWLVASCLLRHLSLCADHVHIQAHELKASTAPLQWFEVKHPPVDPLSQPTSTWHIAPKGTLSEFNTEMAIIGLHSIFDG